MMINHSSCYTLLDKTLLIVIFCSSQKKTQSKCFNLNRVYCSNIYVITLCDSKSRSKFCQQQKEYLV